MGNSFTKTNEDFQETMPLISASPKGICASRPDALPLSFHSRSISGINPVSGPNVESAVNNVAVNPIVYTKKSPSSQVQARSGHKPVDLPRSEVQDTSSFATTRRTPLQEQTRRFTVQLNSASGPRIHMPSSSGGSSKISSASSTTRDARAAMSRIMNRNLNESRDLRIAYDPPPSVVSPQSEDDFDTLSDIEAGRATEYFNERLPFLRHIPPAPDPDSPISSLMYPDSSDEFPVYSPESPRRKRDLGPGYRGEWWQINFDEWNVCIGVYLMGCIVVMMVSACIVAIWILLHQ